MIENNYDKETYKKISLILILFTLFVWVYLTYITFYSFTSKIFQNYYLDYLIIKIHTAKPNSIINCAVNILMYSSAWMTFSPTKTISPENKKLSGQIGFSGLILFIGLYVFQFYYNLGFLGFILNILFFFIFFFTLLLYKRQVEEDLKKDRRNVIESQFDQFRKKVENKYSVNIPYIYSYLGQVRSSWINIINPFRTILVGGTPGSGKSFATIEEIMRQFTKKSFTGVVYDFKFPTLTVKQYNYLTWYQKNFKIPPKFYVINFDDPEYSHRCNPINIDTLETIADADENTKVLMLNINKTWLDKEGDFFTDSANVFTSMLMWYLKILSDKYDYDVCSFPHLVALSTFESTEILFLILKEYTDLKPKMKPFSEALEKGALEQLAGQVSSAGIALAKISSIELNYILTGDDFTLDLNNPLAPKVLCVGNNPDRKQTYGAPIGLILTKISKTINRQKQLPSMFMIDEFPSVYIRGIEDLIATARSNKVSPVLGFQSFAQIEADYGKEISNKILRICGTRIMGQMMDEDAKMISDNIGKQKIETKSYSYSAQDISTSKQVTLEDIVPASHISQFSQGTFCGVIADDFANKDNNKIFVGELCPPLELKNKEEDIKLPKIYDFTPKDIDDRVKKFLNENQEELEIVEKVLANYTIKEWIINIEDTTTERNFYEFFIKENNLDYVTFKKILKEIDFKTSLNKKFKHFLEINIDLSRKFNNEEINDLIIDMIESGICKKHKTEYLQKYNDGIYNDIYKLIALEVDDLKIVDDIYINKTSNRKFYETSVKFFERIADSEKYNDNQIRILYKELVFKLRNTQTN